MVFPESDDACSSRSSTAARPCAASESPFPVVLGQGRTAIQTTYARARTRTGGQRAGALAVAAGGRGRRVAGGGRGSQAEGRAAAAQRYAGRNRGGEGRWARLDLREDMMPQGWSICLIPSTVQIRMAFCLPTGKTTAPRPSKHLTRPAPTLLMVTRRREPYNGGESG